MRSAGECFNEAGLVVFERGWLSSNNVLFAGDESTEAVLVDTGYATHREQTVALMLRALAGRPLDRIINTHLHSDHCGGNQALQAVFGCKIDVPEAEIAKVDAWDMEALTFEATGQTCERFVRTGAIGPHRRVRLGRHSWDVVAAPGHDPSSIALHQPELGVLVSADALWENGFGVVFPELEGAQAFDDVGECLERFAALDVEWVIPGHGAPFSEVDVAISRAMRRLAGFKAAPDRHAWHAAKVLVKFHMLEVQTCPADTLREWMTRTPYLDEIHRRYFSRRSLEVLCTTLIRELVDAGKLRVDSGLVYDA